MRAVVVLLATYLGCAAPSRAAYAYSLVHHPTSTRSAAAQLCFDRGLTLFYSYNRLASQRAFECAAKADPSFAMAYWGIALAHGTNINVTVDPAGERAAAAAIARASALQDGATQPERDYIRTLASRYSDADHPDLHALATSYARAAETLAARYPDDPDAAALYAESLMELQPWRWYSPAGAALGRTNAIIAELQRVLARYPQHIGANHLFIHMTEESPQPQVALTSAARLQNMSFEPAAAHLVHMPAHVYMRTGDFALAARINEHASMHDLAYRHDAGEADPEASYYHDHNLTMLIAGYSEEGDWANAKRVAVQLVQEKAYVPALFAYLRFHRWDDLLAMRAPSADPAEPLRLAIWHFAHGMALAGRGRPLAAAPDLRAVRRLRASIGLAASPGNYNSSSDILGIASLVLAAQIAGAQGDLTERIGLLRSAVAMQDRLLYIEPPDWYYPLRQSLGSALYAAGDHAGAVAAFTADLTRNQRNPRSLYGLYNSLAASGDSADAAWVKAAFDAAWSHADRPLAMSDL